MARSVVLLFLWSISNGAALQIPHAVAPPRAAHLKLATFSDAPAALHQCGWLPRALLTSMLCFSLAGPPSCTSAMAAELEAPMATTASTQSTGSPIATEVVDLLDKYFLDRTFGGVDIKKVKAE